MSYRKSNSPFFTPERTNKHDKGIKGLSTTIGSHFSKAQQKKQSPQAPLQSKDPHQLSKSDIKEAPKNIFQLELLRAKGEVEGKWFSRTEGERQDRHQRQFEYQKDRVDRLVLKEIGSKVQDFIKENSRLRRDDNTEDRSQLKTYQRTIKSMTMGISTAPSRPLSNNEIEDNSNMKDYINRTSKQKQVIQQKVSPVEIEGGQQQKKPNRLSLSSEIKQPLFNEQLLSVQRLQNLKKYFTLYINTAIETNDDKFIAEQKYIEALEKRLVKLEKYQQTLEHFKFQKKVTLQESSRKSKNLSVAGPIVTGDFGQNASVCEQLPVISVTPVQPQVTYQYFPSNERVTIIHDPEVLSELLALREENKNLKELYHIVKVNYEKEIKDHVRDNSDREQMIYRLQKLQAENHFLREESSIKRGGMQ